MTDLIARLEAEVGSRELDFAVAFHIKWRPSMDDMASFVSFKEHEEKHDYETAWIAHAPYRQAWRVPHYTTSIDAKLPWENIVRTWMLGGYWNAEHMEGEGNVSFFQGRASTEPLARRIAALEARGHD